MSEKGKRFRKIVKGNTIKEDVYQLNCFFDGEFKIEEKSGEQEKKESAEKTKKA